MRSLIQPPNNVNVANAIPDIKVLEVRLDGRTVGRLAQTDNRLCAFEYDNGYLKTGFALSPYFLPLKSGVFVAKPTPFRGNFGVFDDSLPDGWGSLLLDRYLMSKGITVSHLSLLQRLSLIGDTGRGALEYRPFTQMVSKQERQDINQLAIECKSILQQSNTDKGLETLYQFAGSSGGARPKVFITIDNKQWLIKFAASNDAENIGEIEYRYSLLARQCGIIMPKTKLFEQRYFGVRRFDRDSFGKTHTVSAAGLLHADFRIPSLDYGDLLNVTLQLTKDINEVKQLFRRMVFNVIISNRDDHAKNFSFQYRNGAWKLSPAYDLLPSTGFNGYHTTTVNNQGNPTLDDIIQVGNIVSISQKEAKSIFDEIWSLCAKN